jgi:hypothetical protein
MILLIKLMLTIKLDTYSWTFILIIIYAGRVERSYLIIYAGISGDVIDYRRQTYIRLNTNYFRQWMGGVGNLLALF